MRISWLELPEKIKFELQQLNEEGNDVAELIELWNNIEKNGINAPGFREKAEVFYKNLEAPTYDIENKLNEPGDWDEIAAVCNINAAPVPQFSSKFIGDRILGGWLGRSAGCLLGKPLEKIPRAGIKELLSSNDTWPLSDYIQGEGIPSNLLEKYPWNRHFGKESLKENIICMTEDDDLNYSMLNLSIYDQHGENFTTENILQGWMEMLPVMQTFTAERVAYLNGLSGLRPPETAAFRNPYREWIGALIRADMWGWVSPAQPARAAEFAFRDASLSHVRNGIYGEIFITVLIANSFIFSDVYELINASLDYIPPDSRLARALKFVVDISVEERDWEDTLDILYDKFGNYHWVHTINNAALITAALISSGNNFEKAICNVVMGGWDTDSNGATVGSVMGSMLGAQKLPSKWIKPLNNRIRSSLKGFDNISLSELAGRTAELSKYEKR